MENKVLEIQSQKEGELEKRRYYSAKYSGIKGEMIIQEQLTEEILFRFCADCQLKPKTMTSYTIAIRNFLHWTREHQIFRPERKDLLCYYEHFGQNHKPATVKLYMNALRCFFSWADEEGYYPNIARHLKTPTVRKEHKKLPLSSEQTREVLAQIPRNSHIGLRDFAMISCMVILGLRTIEISRACLQDVRQVDGQYRFYPFGKGRDEVSGEFLVIPEALENILKKYLNSRQIHLQECLEGYQPDGQDPLFVSYSNNSLGNRLTSISVSKITKAYFRKAGLDDPRYTAHSLRHTAVTLALEADIPIREVQHFARHSSQDITEIYAHDLERKNSKTEQTLASLLLENV